MQAFLRHFQHVRRQSQSGLERCSYQTSLDLNDTGNFSIHTLILLSSTLENLIRLISKDTKLVTWHLLSSKWVEFMQNLPGTLFSEGSHQVRKTTYQVELWNTFPIVRETFCISGWIGQFFLRTTNNCFSSLTSFLMNIHICKLNYHWYNIYVC